MEKKVQAPVEDEWREFEVEERKDYSGLKIGQLQIEDDNEDYDYENEKSGNRKYDNEVTGDNERTSGEPWKKVDENAAAPAPVAAPVAAPTPSTRYVSPGMRDFTVRLFKYCFFFKIKKIILVFFPAFSH